MSLVLGTNHRTEGRGRHSGKLRSLVRFSPYESNHEHDLHMSATLDGTSHVDICL